MKKSIAIQYLLRHFDITKLQKLVVDIGAADGMYTSNSYTFIVDYGWDAVLIEPQLRQLVDAIECHVDCNDRVRFINCAICEEDGTANMFIHPNDGDGLTTNNHGSSLVPIPGSRVQIMVATMSYETLVREVDFSQVGLLAIDTEGYDDRILAGIFAATPHRPGVIISETNYYLINDDGQRRRDLMKKDYELIYSQHDQIYVRRDLL